MNICRPLILVSVFVILGVGIFFIYPYVGGLLIGIGIGISLVNGIPVIFADAHLTKEVESET